MVKTELQGFEREFVAPAMIEILNENQKYVGGSMLFRAKKFTNEKVKCFLPFKSW